jgi:C1A family cysteine protease
MATNVKRYGWIPDLPDQRDFMYAAPLAVLRALPPKKDLTPECPPVYDQGELGSCTANAIGAAHHFGQLKQFASQRTSAPAGDCRKAFMPSRLFIYYNERVMRGSVDQDSGAMIRDGIKSVVKQGVCPEAGPSARLKTGRGVWPYEIRKFTVKPPKACYTEAMKHQVVSYQRVTQTVNQMKGCLASGYPFVFGFTVYESFETKAVAKTGKVPMPRAGEDSLGGHAVAAVGYNDATQRFIVRNSWGGKWGKKGYCFMPYAYLTDPDLAADFWTIRLVEMPADPR